VPLSARLRARTTLAGLFLGLALGQAEIVSASTFRVTPVQVALSSTSPTVLLSLGNESDQELRFQVSAFAWGMDDQGQMQLTPTQDIVFFPMLLTLAPGAERKIRVGSATTAGATEKTYRIFVEELPPTASSKTATTTGSQVHVLTRMGIPIFLEPPRPESTGSIEVLGLEGGRLRYRIHNTGNVHFLLQTVRVRGFGASGEDVVDRKADGWYVLAGGSREYSETLSPDECTRLKTLSIEARTDHDTITAHVEPPAGACGAPAAHEPKPRAE
jgi:fimbrial chaperone protein